MLRITGRQNVSHISENRSFLWHWNDKEIRVHMMILFAGLFG